MFNESRNCELEGHSGGLSSQKNVDAFKVCSSYEEPKRYIELTYPKGSQVIKVVTISCKTIYPQ